MKDDLVERYTAAEIAADLRTHAYDDCGERYVPTHLCHIAAQFVETQAARLTAYEARIAELEGALGRIDKWCCPLLCVNCADNRETARQALASRQGDAPGKGEGR